MGQLIFAKGGPDMNTETYFALKQFTRENMRRDGIITETEGGSYLSPKELEHAFFPLNPMVGMLTHEPEANNAGYHSHLHFEIIYIVSGTCVQETEDGQKITLTKGNICILNPLAQHSLRISSPADQVLVFAIKPALFNNAFFSFFEDENAISSFCMNYMLSMSTKNYLLFTNSFNTETDSLIGHLIETFLHNSRFAVTELKSLLVLFFSVILQNLTTELPAQDQTKLSEIMSYMNRHLKTVTLQSTAEHFHFHPNYLSAYMKKQSGRTFSNILQELRLVQAKYYLTSTDLSISHISELLGYQDQPSFNAMFRKNVGSSPSEFRKFNTAE